MDSIADYITPFTVTTRGTFSEINDIVKSDVLLSEMPYSVTRLSFREIVEKCENNNLIFNKGIVGYKSNLILEGIHFLICGAEGNLNGTRPRGNQEDCFSRIQKEDPNCEFIIMIPDYYSVLIIRNDKYAVMIGCIDPKLSRKLLVRDKNNKYLVSMEKPVFGDLTHV